MLTTTFIVWKDRYSVGNDELDGDHRRIIAIINDLHNSIRDQSTASQPRELIDRLFDYTQTHFTREERLMEEHGYADLKKHCAIHGGMIQRTKELQALSWTEENNAASEALSFLKDWWIDHILVMDSRYKSCLADEGPTAQP